MWEYLRANPGQSLRSSPFRAPLKAWALLPVFVVISVAIGFPAGLLNVEPMTSKSAVLLPLTLFIFPSLLEEAFFRGSLIPRNIVDAGATRAPASAL